MPGFQEIVVFVIVIIAGVFAARTFMRQFVRGNDEDKKCAACPVPTPETKRD